MSKQLLRNLILAVFYGVCYCLIEVLYRGYTHWTMALVGGLCGICVGCLNEVFTWNMSMLTQGVIGSCIITVIEFVSGYILNIKLGMNIWDYSNLPFNICGQVCLIFSIIWIFLAMAAVYVDDYLRWKLFDEERGVYHLI